MLNTDQIILYIKARLKALYKMCDIVLDNTIRDDIDMELLNIYEREYDDNMERIGELHRLLSVIKKPTMVKVTLENECESSSNE